MIHYANAKQLKTASNITNTFTDRKNYWQNQRKWKTPQNVLLNTMKIRWNETSLSWVVNCNCTSICSNFRNWKKLLAIGDRTQNISNGRQIAHH